MNAFASRILRLLLVFPGALAALRAQEPAAPPAPIVFSAFAWDVFNAEKDPTLNFRRRGKLQSVELAWRDRSTPQACDGPGPLVFTHTEVRDGKSTEVPAASAEIPAGMTRALLVFGRNAARGPDALPYSVFVIDDSYEVFPGQSVRFINRSRVEVAGSVGDRMFTVAPGREQVVAALLAPGARMSSLRLAGRDSTGSWRKLRSTMLPMSVGQRVLIFLVDDPRRPDSPEMVLLRDQVEPEASSPSPAGRAR